MLTKYLKLLLISLPYFLKSNGDAIAFNNYLKNLSIPGLTGPKLIRFGNQNATKPRPLKIICQSKDETFKLIDNFTSEIRYSVSVPNGFCIVHGKTKLERELLRKAHGDLEQAKKDGSSDLTISYINGVPLLVNQGPKNWIPGGRRF